MGQLKIFAFIFNIIFAVYDLKMFKKWTSSLVFTYMPLLGCLILTSLIIFISKALFKTTSSYFYCQDGFSTDYIEYMRYLIVTSVIGILMPNLLVIILYKLTRYLIQQSIQRTYNIPSKKILKSTRLADVTIKIKSNLQEKLLKQLFWINIFLQLSSLMFFLASATTSIPIFLDELLWMKYAIRILTIFSGLIVPILCLSTNQQSKQSMRRFSSSIINIFPFIELKHTKKCTHENSHKKYTNYL